MESCFFLSFLDRDRNLNSIHIKLERKIPFLSLFPSETIVQSPFEIEWDSDSIEIIRFSLFFDWDCCSISFGIESNFESIEKIVFSLFSIEIPIRFHCDLSQSANRSKQFAFLSLFRSGFPFDFMPNWIELRLNRKLRFPLSSRSDQLFDHTRSWNEVEPKQKIALLSRCSIDIAVRSRS